MESTAKGYLVLGCSGSGKTYLAVSIANNSSLPTFVINGNEEDFNSDNFEHITYEDLADNIDDYSNSIVVADDVVRPSENVCKIINEVLVKHKRHSNITLFCLAHALEKNNLHSMIQHFDFIVFTCDRRNTPVFKIYIKKYCPMNKDECMHIWEDFLKGAATNYLRFNVKATKFEIVDIKLNVLESSESKLRKEIFRYIEPNNDYVAESMAFFDYLIKKLPANSVSENQHILQLKNERTNGVLKINIIDLVWYVPRKKLERVPPSDVVTAFRSLKKLYMIPNCMIGNKWFYD